MLDRYPGARTHTIQQAQNWFGAEHPNGWIRTNSQGPFQFFTNVVRTPRIRLAWANATPECEFMLPAMPHIRHIFPIRTPGRYRFGKHLPVVSEASTGCLIPPDEDILISQDKGVEKITIRIPQDVLDAMFASLNGDASRQIAFTFGTPPSRNQARFLRQAVLAFAEEINAFGPEMPSVALAELEQSVIARFVLFNAHNHSNVLLLPPPGTSNDRVGRAEDFIRENWDQPLDFETLSRITNTSIRTLFRSFKELRGYSPSDFVKRVRLEQARDRIMHDRNESIIAIAMKCGFQNVGRFASVYRNAYGELPSETRKEQWPSDTK